MSNEELERVKQAAMAWPGAEIRKSTGGAGIHIYCWLDGISTANHTEHAALARCILGMMSSETGFDFASQNEVDPRERQLPEGQVPERISAPLWDALYPLPYPSARLESRLIDPAPGRHFSAGRPPRTTAGHPTRWPAKWLNPRPPPTRLRRLIGIERESGVPKAWNVSRFLEVLGQEPHASELRRIFNGLVRPLGVAVPDLGKNTAGDSTALHARAKGEQAAKAEIADGLPQPSGGKKEYLDDDGKVTKIVEWFGYKLHLLVDAKHEVALAYEVTTANAADSKSLPGLVEQAQANLPAGRIETLAYDKAADDNESHRRLNRAGIRPVIQNRRLCKDQTEQMLPGHDGRSKQAARLGIRRAVG